MKTRQALSIARIRAERRKKLLCLDCNNPAAVKLIASTGKLKVLSYCEQHLAWHRQKKAENKSA